MVNSYYGIYQAERGRPAAEMRAADAQLGGLAAGLGQLGSVPVQVGSSAAARLSDSHRLKSAVLQLR